MADRLALLLHMHQPDYRDPETGEPRMPWVRLHASRGYTDVPALAAEAGAMYTLNVVPSLLLQLQAYRQGATDRWERLSRRPAEDLAGEDLDFVRRRFVHGHPQLRRASPRYAELAARAATLASPAELRDLQVWSNLAWVGVVGQRDPLVQALRAQDRDFDHEQLLALMDLQRGLLHQVLDRWKAVPSLSCSPLCHPILPLLIDFKHARRCLPGLPAELGEAGTFAWPEDARRQLVEAVAACEQLLGRRPGGLWPSEGALSPEVLDLVAELGFAWVASDEGLLQHSRHEGRARIDGPWVRPGAESGLRLLFRDHDLSDRIGFVYQHWDGTAAVADLLGAAAERHGPGAGAVPVVLDGENPWEAYPDAGEGFLRALFGSGRTCTLDAAAQAGPRGRIQHLHTGSWIDADLHIWAGDEEDRRGWALLARTRATWQARGCPEAAWLHLANAESSDWFWWFGPEHHTEVADLFDALFRAHLAAAWRDMGLPVPAELAEPVGLRPPVEGALHPHAPIAPSLDGHLHPVDWTGAAHIPPPAGGSMSRGRAWLLGGAVGMGAGTLWLRLDLPADRPQLRLEREGAPTLDLAPGPGLRLDEGEGHMVAAIPWGGGAVRLALVALRGDTVLARYPEAGWLEVIPPPI